MLSSLLSGMRKYDGLEPAHVRLPRLRESSVRIHLGGAGEHDRITCLLLRILLGDDSTIRCPVRQCPVLLPAQLDHVTDSFLHPFDVSVEHGCIGVQAKLMGRSVDIEPDISTNLALECLIVDTVVEDLRATPRQ